MTLKTSDYDYDLPEELIAQTPTKDRLACRLLKLRATDGHYEDCQFEDVASEFEAGDVLVLNNTRVLPARLYGHRQGTGGHVEVLLLKNTTGDQWEVLVRPARKLHEGGVLEFGDGRLKATILKELNYGGGRLIEFSYDGIFLEILESLGEMPLPPYIKEKLDDPERYQTVYAKENGAAAAPTAGLHFTKDYLKKLEEKGVKIAYLTLHVGLGTFRPVNEEDIEDHEMHSEFYHLDEENAEIIRRAKEEGRQVVACGTTCIRTLETIGAKFDGKVQADSGWTSIFIYPGFKYRLVDSFITNFHLPKSTLVMLVAAFTGREHILDAYRHAVEEKYMFFSFGDAMFIRGPQNPKALEENH